MDQAVLIKRMRKYLDEMIPSGKTEDDTRFLDEELLDLYNEYGNLNKAVSVGWTLKASMIPGELGGIEQYSTGDENYKNINLATAVNAALSMAKQFEDLYQQEINKDASGFMMMVQKPEVI